MKAFFVLIVLTSISLVSCDNETVSDSFSLGLENDFKINGEYHSADNSLNFSLTEINDSRCPSDVECVWQGKADVKINVKSPISGSLILNTYDQTLDTIGIYSFELIEVSPYPVSTNVIKLEDYNVKLKIVELTD